MQLAERSLEGRGFLLQFVEIVQEFGEVIPWLRPAEGLRYLTNGSYFKKQLESVLGCQGQKITAYQLTDAGRGREYVGGLLHFSYSPEHFLDARNQEVTDALACEGAHYISCVQIREVKRGAGNGALLMHKALAAIRAKHPHVWAVCEPELADWYRRLGANICIVPHNKDGLCILEWRPDRP